MAETLLCTDDRLFVKSSHYAHYSRLTPILISPNVETSNAFLRIILESFDVPTWRSYDQSLKNLETFLLEQYQQGKVPVLLIDEEQNLTRDCLKLIHYLLQFETATVKLPQIVLVGQEELAETIPLKRCSGPGSSEEIAYGSSTPKKRLGTGAISAARLRWNESRHLDVM